MKNIKHFFAIIITLIIISLSLALAGCSDSITGEAVGSKQKQDKMQDYEKIAKNYYEKALNGSDWVYCDTIIPEYEGEYSRKACFAAVEEQTGCFDSDDGRNLYVKGVLTVRDVEGEANDFCSNDLSVIEFFCKGEEPTYALMGCGQGRRCVDGACVLQSEIVSETNQTIG